MVSALSPRNRPRARRAPRGRWTGSAAFAPFAFALALASSSPAGAQEAPGFLSFGVAPTGQVPLGGSASLFEPGAGFRLEGRYALPGSGLFFLSGALDYRYGPTKVEDPSSLSFISLGAGGGLDFAFAEAMGLRVGARAGAYADLYAMGGAAYFAANPFVEAGVDLYLVLGSSSIVELGSSYRNDLGLWNGVGLSLGASVALPSGGTTLRAARALSAARSGVAVIEESADKVLLGNLVLEPVFPVLFKHYFSHPVGMARVINRGKAPMEDLRVKLVNRQYMGASTESAPVTLAPGGTVAVELSALFTDAVLQVTEGTRVAVEIEISYTVEGRRHLATKVQELQIHGRNALTWDPDSKAAAFVTAKDPVILAFAKDAVGLSRDYGNPALDRKIGAAMAVWHLLKERGMRYTVDPLSSYAARGERGAEPDFLQFPRETLRFGGGDCDDLTLLDCALLEAVGVETAMITVPGHIFMAFSTGMTREQAGSWFSRPADLVYAEDGGAWIPVEVTELSGGFLKAWELGARQWRDASASGSASFIPVHEAWMDYEPVGLPGDETLFAMPGLAKAGAAFKAELSRFVDREMADGVKKIGAEIAAAPQDPKPLNKLGVFYAKWGLYAQAEERLLAAVRIREYAPALVNLGNISLLSKDAAQAIDFFDRARNADAKNAVAALGLARASYELERWDAAASLYAEAAKLDPRLEADWSWLGRAVAETTKAADSGARDAATLWAE